MIDFNQDIPAQLNDYFNDAQKIIMLFRQIELSVGCAILLSIIVSIVYKRLYVYNTTKLFMFFCLSYFVGMLIVLLHIPKFFSQDLYYYDELYQYEIMKQHYIFNVLEGMKQENKMIWCALQAFINLFAYNVGYFFAILISYNVFCVINQNHRNFMKNVFKMNKVRVTLVLMLIIYIVPFVLSLCYSNFNQYFAYSYGPSGFKIEKKVDNWQRQYVNANLFLFCGVCSNPDQIGHQFLGILNVYLVPLFLFIIHSLILYENRKQTQTILTSQYLNSKQIFLIKSGKISIIVFLIQGVNFFKSFIVLLPVIKQWYTFVIGINFAFDLYPFIILYFYWKYTKEKKGIVYGSSTILSEE